MSNLIPEKLVDKLAGAMRRDIDSNNYKLLELAESGYTDQLNTLETIKIWLDIDKAEGVPLDVLGEKVGQHRGSMDDETYRQRIKIRIRTNLSKGDVETLNEIGVLLMGDYFDGILEGNMFGLYHPSIGDREAALLFILNGKGLIEDPPIDELDSLVAGGVRSNVEVLYRPKIKIKVEYEEAERPPQTYIRSGEFETQEELYTIGGKIK